MAPKCEFEWSESGLILLDTIQKFIAENGGRDALFEVVNEEVNKTSYYKDKRVKLDLLKIIRKHGLPVKDALPILRMTISQYERFKAENI